MRTIAVINLKGGVAKTITYGLGYVVGGKISRIINGTSGWKKLKVIAWMPLPRPYEEGK